MTMISKSMEIAHVLSKLDNNDVALSIHQRCKNIYEYSLGKDHPSTVATYNNYVNLVSFLR